MTRETGPALPSEPRAAPGNFESGMTLREWYIGMALQGSAAYAIHPEAIVSRATRIADAALGAVGAAR